MAKKKGIGKHKIEQGVDNAKAAGHDLATELTNDPKSQIEHKSLAVVHKVKAVVHKVKAAIHGAEAEVNAEVAKISANAD